MQTESHVDNSFGNSKIFPKTNIMGTHNIIELSRYYSVKKIIHISTDEVYGDILKGSFSENNSLNPTNPYLSKAAAEMIIKSYIKSLIYQLLLYVQIIYMAQDSILKINSKIYFIK